ncbi:hypothetical protein Tco_0532636 [Tanacetum coccineum]
MNPSITQREETYQVALDIIKNTPFYKAFLISADGLEIYMQQFWLTIKKVKKSFFYQIDIDNKTCQIDVELSLKLPQNRRSRLTGVKTNFNTKLVAQVKELGSTDDEAYLLAYKDENHDNIPWYSSNDDESDYDDDEQDESDDSDNDDEEEEDDDDKQKRKKPDEEPKVDDQATDAQPNDDQVIILDSVTHKDKVSVISKSRQAPPHTPTTPPLPATLVPPTQVSNSKAISSTINSQQISWIKPPRCIPEGQSTIEAAKSHSEYELKNILYKKMHKSGSYLIHDTRQELYDALTWSIKLDEITPKEDQSYEKVLKKRDRGDNKDEDPLARPNQGKETKKRRTGKEAESSQKPSKSKESTKGKPPSKSSKTANDANEPQVDPKPRTPKPQWFTQPPRPETHDPDWNIVNMIDDAQE